MESELKMPADKIMSRAHLLKGLFYRNLLWIGARFISGYGCCVFSTVNVLNLNETSYRDSAFTADSCYKITLDFMKIMTGKDVFYFIRYKV